MEELKEKYSPFLNVCKKGFIKQEKVKTSLFFFFLVIDHQSIPFTQLVFTWSYSTMETPEQCLKSVQK